MELQYKSLHVAQFKTLDAAEGIAEMIVSVFNNVDAAKERIRPGFFTDSLKVKLPKGVWMHQWDTPVAKTLEAYELLAGDARLPEEVRHLGGLYVKGQFNLGTQRGKDAFSDLQFGTVDEFSIGYLVQEDSSDAKTGIRDLIKGTLYEWSPVLVGCNPATVLMGTKGTEMTTPPANPAETKTITAENDDKSTGCMGADVAHSGKDDSTKTLLVLGQSVEVKSLYLGDNIENAMTMAALSRLNDALYYSVISRAILGCYEWDDEAEEYVRTPMPAEDAIATIGAACDEFKEIALRVITAILSSTPAQAVESAKALQDIYPEVKSDDLADLSTLPLSPRAGIKLADHSEQALASVQEFKGRVQDLLALRVKEGRTLSQATKDRLQKQYDALSSACQDMKALLDENQAAADTIAEEKAQKHSTADTDLPQGEMAPVEEKDMDEAYSRFLELSSVPLDSLL